MSGDTLSVAVVVVSGESREILARHQRFIDLIKSFCCCCTSSTEGLLPDD
jgi:hypothetical protein